MVFETKKINLETLSEYLSEVRRQLGLSMEEVGNRTGIQPKFLESLENGDYAKLPADVYVYGFLKQLAELYAVDCETLRQQYKKERGIQQQLVKQKQSNVAESKRQFHKVVVTPKLVSAVLGIAFVIATLGYIVWQVSSINKTPDLEIFQPQDRQVIRQSSVEVSGRTDPGMALAINDQNVFVNSDGSFHTQIGVGNGPKDLIFTVKNKFDKSVSKTVSIIGDTTIPAVAGAATTTPVSVTLNLSFTATTTLEVTVDDAVPQQSVYGKGDTVVFTGQSKILISTDNAGATIAALNGQNMGALGRPGEHLSDIPFSAGSDTINTRGN